MANSNISTDTTKQTGYNLSRTSYDTRQEISAKVIGILKYNNDIREKLLKRNIGLYSLSNLNEGIGYISNLYSLESSKPLSLGEDGLLGYTHIFKSDFQNSINKKYNIGDEITYYQHGSIPDSNFLKWNGEYDDYTTYIDEITGIPTVSSLNFLSSLFQTSKLNNSNKIIGSEEETLTIASILNDILQYDNIKYAMEKTRIGTVTPNPTAALYGAVTTNINNFSGTDTKLGLITNYLYANTLRNGAHFNSLRKTKYITPKIYENIGNKLSTISTINSDFRVDDETGRIIADFGKNEGTLTLENITLQDYVDGIENVDPLRNIADTTHARYKNIVANWNPNKKHYSPFTNTQYNWKSIGFNLISIPSTRITSDFATKTTHVWNEGKNDDVTSINGFGVYKNIKPKDDTDDLISKTYKLLKSQNENEAIDTLIGRFHTEGKRDINHNQSSLLQTAVSYFGMSHGRNLLTKSAYDSKQSYDNIVNGYDNPYCRTWTYHHQYDNVSNLIRPFGIETVSDDGESSHTLLDIRKLQERWDYGRSVNGVPHLSDNTVLGRHGFVNIAPTTGDNSSKIKNCMFSIENLAWKDVPKNENNLSEEQRGPNGGRIMWFPPYDLKFNENVSVNWNQNEFIGRGEKIYTYTNTERSGTLSFILLVDHPSVIDEWKTAPKGKTGNDEYDEQTLLRFFAGCEVLTFDNEFVEPSYFTEQQVSSEEEIPIVSNNTKSDIIYAFFPHNYSGKHESMNEAIEYLTQKYGTKNTGNEDNVYRTDDDTVLIKNILDNLENKKDNNKLYLNDTIAVVTTQKGYEDAKITFKDFINNKDYIKDKDIRNVIIRGYSSTQEYDKETDNNGNIKILNSVKKSDKKRNSDDELSERRAYFINKVIKKITKIDNDKITIEPPQTIRVKIGEENNVSSESAVLSRCVKITITYTDKRDNILTNDFVNWVLENIEEHRGKTYDDIKKLSYDELVVLEKAKVKADKLKAKQEKKQRKAERKVERRKERKCNKKNPKADYCDDGTDISDSINTVVENTIIDRETEEPKDVQTMTNARTISGYKTLTQEEQDGLNFKRWENESKYFETLENTNSFLYSRIVDKIKYFTPAFHSITPEGFNARLGFLHQCTRQGHTYSVSDTNNSLKSAGNMAFGLPPICVLRIGDFYHTKIVIDSVTMNYENPQWDMNPEGIGMQPMFAHISLNFKFLGGSDIEGPIARLQNAISFNYYANQSVYDNRADKTQYDNNTAKIVGTPWRPSNT